MSDVEKLAGLERSNMATWLKLAGFIELLRRDIGLLRGDICSPEFRLFERVGFVVRLWWMERRFFRLQRELAAIGKELEIRPAREC